MNDYDGELPKGRLIVKAKSLLGDVTQQSGVLDLHPEQPHRVAAENSFLVRFWSIGSFFTFHIRKRGSLWGRAWISKQSRGG
jgi:hypothetical protein